MKTSIFCIVPLVISFCGYGQKNSQKNLLNENSFVTVNIEKITDDVKQSFQQNYSTKGMTEEQKEVFIQKLTDSVWSINSKATPYNNNKLKLQIENKGEAENLLAYQAPEGNNIKLKVHISIGSQEIYKEVDVVEQRIAGVNMFELAKGIPELNEDLLRKYNSEYHSNKTLEDFISVKEKLENSAKKEKNNADEDAIDFESNSETIKNLQVKTIQNTQNQVIVSFLAVKHSDVYIIATNLAGKEISTKRISEFEGAYNDVLSLPENTSGTIFINVIQGDDGAVKRVVLN